MIRSEGIGMNKKEVQEMRDMLIGLLNQKMKEIGAIQDPEAQRRAFAEYLDLDRQLKQVEEGLLRKYSINLLESLEKEAHTLRYLTIVLIVLTVVLSILTGLLAFRH